MQTESQMLADLSRSPLGRRSTDDVDVAVKIQPGLAPISTERRIQTVLVTQVGPSHLQPRQHIKEGESAELLTSVRTYGVIEPLIVRLRPPSAEGTAPFDTPLELVAGEQRWTAASKAGLGEIDVVVRELTDAQVIEFGLVENCRRADLHPMDEAAAYERLLAMDRAYTPDVLAARVGKDVSTVRKRLKLLQLEDIIRAAFLVEAITVKHAEKLATLSRDLQLKAFRDVCFSDLLLGEDIDDLLDGRNWEALAPALQPVNELSNWIHQHTVADVSSPEVQAELPELAQYADRVDPETGELLEEAPEGGDLLQLSGDEYLAVPEARALGVSIPGRDYKLVEKKAARCPSTRKGCIVQGGPLALVDVCADKTCEKHWPQKAKKERDSTGRATAPKVDYAEEDRKREEARKQWDADLAVLGPALAAHVKSQKPRLSIALVTEAINGDYYLEVIAKGFGVPLTDANAVLVLALATVARHCNGREWFLKAVKPFKFDAAKVLKDATTVKQGAALKSPPQRVKGNRLPAPTKKPAAKKPAPAKKAKGARKK